MAETHKRARLDTAATALRMETCTAPVNIAVIKYWGKRDEKLLLPINSSLSGTLSQQELFAKTTVATSPDFTTDRIWLNGKEEDINNPRLQNCLAGIAALGKLHSLDMNLSSVAAWAREARVAACLRVCALVDGAEADGSDSLASQVVDASHWPLDVLVLVVHAGKKETPSSIGMQTSVRTSALIQHRAEHGVPQRMADIEKAIQERDFKTFGEITIKDSNQFHAICLDTYPPIMYMTDVSKSIVNLLSKYNADKGLKAAYTLDAGPNVVIYCEPTDTADILALVNKHFPPTSAQSDFFRGRTTTAPPASTADYKHEGAPGGIQYILHTGIGSGPCVLGSASALLGADGRPLSISL